MLDAHSKVGIAQTCFYVPALILVLYLNFRHGFRRERGWIFLLIFSCMRLAGGITVIVLSQHPTSVGLVIASTIFLGVGVPPLLIATMSLLGTACAVGFEDTPMLHKAILLSRFFFFVAIAFLITGGTLVGFANLATTGQKLLQAAYIILAVFLAIIVAFQAYLMYYRTKFQKAGAMIFKATVAAVPLLAVRIAYAFLLVFHPSQVKWEPLYGSVGAFVGMALVPEYITLAMYVYVGLRTPKSRHSRRAVQEDGDLYEQDSGVNK